jgi:hypothetical protein
MTELLALSVSVAAIDHADDRLAERFGITTRRKEAACGDEPNPNESEAPKRPQRDKGPNAAQYARIKPMTSMLNDLRRPDTPRVVRRQPRG